MMLLFCFDGNSNMTFQYNRVSCMYIVYKYWFKMYTKPVIQVDLVITINVWCILGGCGMWYVQQI